MKMEQKKTVQQHLKKDLELLAKRSLTSEETFDAYFNLSGFLKVLKKMKKLPDRY